MRGSILVKVGIRAIILGVIVFLAGWYWAPTTIPVNQRLSLKRGSVEVPDFEVNTESTYDIGLWFENADLAQKPGCDGLKYPDSVIRIHWILSRDLKPIAEGITSNRWFGRFGSSPGRYQLRLDVLSDTDCLNAASPWLSVVSDADPDPWNTRFWAGFLILLGIAIMLPARTVRKPVEITPEITPSPDSGRAPLRQRRNWPLQKRLAVLPSFGLAASLIVALGVVGFRLVEASRETIPATGIYVRLSVRDYNEAKKNIAVSPLVVSVVRTKNDSPQFLLNGNEIKFGNLHDALKKELSRRADWVVFVDGDNDLPFQDVVAVVDAANSLQAKCVILTPHLRQEAK